LEAIAILTNMPDRASALSLGQYLIDQRLAACVNILSPCTSIYRWQGKIETADEIPLLIKSQSSLYSNIEQAIKAKHPYEVPEIITLPINKALPAYLKWLIDETTEQL
jgi:periplasmic divalent cation tolerance protein